MGLLTGTIASFSFKDVALSAIAGGHGIASTAARGAVANIATQGIALATGLQSKFDWTGVAAAAAGSGVGRLAGRALPGSAHINAAGEQVSATWSNQLGASMASSIADAATRSAIDSTSFGDNLRASIPNVIGQAIGNALVDGVSMSIERAARIEAAREVIIGTEQAIARRRLFEAGIPYDIQLIDPSHLNLENLDERATALAEKLYEYSGSITSGTEAGLVLSQATAAVANASSDPDFIYATAESLFDLQATNVFGDQNIQFNDGTFSVQLEGSPPELVNGLIDGFGFKAHQFNMKVAGLLEEHPTVGVGLTLLDAGLTIAQGPFGAAKSKLGELVLGRAEDEAVGFIANQAVNAGYSQPSGNDLGDGFLTLTTLLIDGVSAAAALGTIAVRRRRTGNPAELQQAADAVHRAGVRMDPADARHILFGDNSGGGHIWPGNPGKTPFPETWRDVDILSAIDSVIRDNNTIWYGHSPGGLTKSGNAARWESFETVNNVRIRTIYEPTNGRVITAYPSNALPSMPRIN